MAESIFKRTRNLWSEWYRPQTLKEYIADADFKEKFEDMIKKQSIPHLLLYGSHGGGKSSLSNLLVSNIECDVLHINASKERGIDTVRTSIEHYCVNSSFYNIKILVLEEFDKFTNDGQEALRDVIEAYCDSTRFIFTCNDVDQINGPIRSRCQEYNIVPPSREKVLAKCKFILDSEKVGYDLDDVANIVNYNYPDVRKTINILQQYTINDELKLTPEYFKLVIYKNKIVDILKLVTKDNLFDKITEIRQLLADTKVKKFNELFRHLYNSLNEIVLKQEHIIPLTLILAKGQLNDSQVVDKEINIIATLIEMAEALTK